MAQEADEIKKEVDLDHPFTEDTPAGEPKVEEETKVAEEVEAEKPRVPYSRFENVNRARREAEEEAEKWRVRAIEAENARFQPRQSEEGVPQWWTKLYGDTDQAKEAYGIWFDGQQQTIQQAEERALEAVQRREAEAREAEKQNLSSLDEHLEMVSAVAGRDLTDKEQSDILDIIDEYTAKDEDGNYLGAILPPDKAWDIYEMKNEKVKAPQRASRDNVARVVSAPSSGEPTPEQVERNKNWRPWDTSRYPS